MAVRAGRSTRVSAFAIAFALACGAVPATVAHAAPTAVQIDVGGPGGDGFLADTYGTGGVPDAKPASRRSLPNWMGAVTHPIPAETWHTSRFLASTYAVTGLEPGGYEVRLYFMDWYFTRPGQRIFDVAVNGTRVLTDFDIVGTAIARGADGAAAFGVEKDFPVTVDESGELTIDFIRGAENQPQVNAIAVVPTG
ncbi:MAG: malectin domain-containing carbohydrate-binding protein [Kibdelosporangium sp.]